MSVAAITPVPAARAAAIGLLGKVEKLLVVAGLLVSTGGLQGWLVVAGAGGGQSRVVALLLPVFAFSTVAALFRGSQVATAVIRNPALAALPIAALVSATWSIAPTTTLWKAVSLCATYLFALYLVLRFDLRTIVRLAAYAILLTAALSLVAVAIMPNQAIMTGIHDGAWRGSFGHKNGLGKAMALGVLCCVTTAWLDRAQRRVMACGAFVCIVLAILTTSASSLVLVVGSVGVVVLARQVVRLKPVVLIPSSILLLGSLVVAGYWLLQNWTTLLSALGRDPTLTGRTTLWAVLLIEVLRRPLLGFGYGAFWSDQSSVGANVGLLAWDAAHAHSGYLEIALDLGAVGVVLAVSALAWATLRGMAVARFSREGVVGIGYLTFLVAANSVEGMFIRHNSIYFVLFACVAHAAFADRCVHDSSSSFGPIHDH